MLFCYSIGFFLRAIPYTEAIIRRSLYMLDSFLRPYIGHRPNDMWRGFASTNTRRYTCCICVYGIYHVVQHVDESPSSSSVCSFYWIFLLVLSHSQNLNVRRRPRGGPYAAQRASARPAATYIIIVFILFVYDTHTHTRQAIIVLFYYIITMVWNMFLWFLFFSFIFPPVGPSVRPYMRDENLDRNTNTSRMRFNIPAFFIITLYIYVYVGHYYILYCSRSYLNHYTIIIIVIIT